MESKQKNECEKNTHFDYFRKNQKNHQKHFTYLEVYGTISTEKGL